MNNLEQVSETRIRLNSSLKTWTCRRNSWNRRGARGAVEPPEDVATLMQQVADEHGLEFAADLPAAGTTVPAKQAEKDLSMRLEELKGA